MTENLTRKTFNVAPLPFAKRTYYSGPLLIAVPMTTTSYNRKSPAVKRILQEAKELQQDPSVEYTARPLEENIFEWHFTVSGPVGTEFDGGRYHGRILLPNEYPFKPPEVIFLTPNGRFELNKKICLSITGFHPEYWQPAWGVRTVMLGIMGFFPTRSEGAIGGIDYVPEERKKLARSSRSWTCTTCEICNIELLPEIPETGTSTHHTADTNAGDMPQFSFAYADNKIAKPQLVVNEESTDNETNVGDDNDANVQPRSANDSIDTTEIPVESREAQQHNDAKSGRTDHHVDSTQGPPTPVQGQLARACDSRSHLQTLVTSTSSPRWLDVLIIGLLAVLTGLVVRRFL